MSLGVKMLSGALWTWVSRVGFYAISIISTTILARILPSSAYGLMGMVVVFTGFLSLFRDLGGGMAVVRQKDPTQEFLSSVFWGNIGMAIATAGVLIAIAPAVAAFYKEPQVVDIMMVLAIPFVISGISIVHNAMLRRQMAFRTLAMIELASSAVSTATAIQMAMSGAGVWSLVGASVALALTTTVLQMACSRWRPSFYFRWAELSPVFSFSINLFGFNTVNYGLRNSDKFLIGRYLGAVALGHYQFAYTLMLFPLQNITWALGNVLFSAFATIQDDNARFRSGYLRATRLIALITFPVMLGMMATAGPLIRTILGERWLAVIPIVVILAPVGLVQSVTSTVGQIYMAKGRTDLQFRWAIISGVVILPAMWIGLRWGAPGVAATYTIATLLLSYPLLTMALPLIDLKIGTFLASLWPCLWSSIVMAVVVTLVRMSLERTGLVVGIVFLISVLTGIIVYAGVLLVTKAEVLADVMELLSKAGYGKFLPAALKGRRKDSAKPSMKVNVR